MIVENLPQWHEAVCQRDGYRCRICGKDYSEEFYFQEDNNRRVNQYVCGHHTKTQKAYPELRFETDIGICVDKECHAGIHNGSIQIDAYLSPVLEVKKERTVKTFVPNNSKRLKGWENMCKCGKYVVMEITGKCMRCEKFSGPSFKEKPKKKKDDK